MRPKEKSSSLLCNLNKERYEITQSETFIIEESEPSKKTNKLY